MKKILLYFIITLTICSVLFLMVRYSKKNDFFGQVKKAIIFGKCDKNLPKNNFIDCILEANDLTELKPTKRQKQLEDALLTPAVAFKPQGSDNKVLGAAFEVVEYNTFTIANEFTELWLLKLKQCQEIVGGGCEILSKVRPSIDLSTPNVEEFSKSLENINNYIDEALR